MTPMANYIYKNVIQVVRNCPLILKGKKTFINREAELDGDGEKVADMNRSSFSR